MRCLHCGTTVGLSVQHRATKGSGGSRSGERPANGCILCVAFNVALEADAGLAAWAREMGWKISRYDDPAEVPVYDVMDGCWYRLTDDLTPEGRVRVA